MGVSISPALHRLRPMVRSREDAHDPRDRKREIRVMRFQLMRTDGLYRVTAGESRGPQSRHVEVVRPNSSVTARYAPIPGSIISKTVDDLWSRWSFWLGERPRRPTLAPVIGHRRGRRRVVSAGRTESIDRKINAGDANSGCTRELFELLHAVHSQSDRLRNEWRRGSSFFKCKPGATSYFDKMRTRRGQRQSDERRAHLVAAAIANEARAPGEDTSVPPS